MQVSQQLLSTSHDYYITEIAQAACPNFKYIFLNTRLQYYLEIKTYYMMGIRVDTMFY